MLFKKMWSLAAVGTVLVVVLEVRGEQAPILGLEGVELGDLLERAAPDQLDGK